MTDADGNPISPKVEVMIKNTSNKPVISGLQGVDPRARDRSTGLGRIAVTGDFPIPLGTLAPGQEVMREFDLVINEDGRFEFVALATGGVEGSPVVFTSTGRGGVIAVGEPYPVEIKLDFVRTPAITNQNNGAFLMQPGSKLEVFGSVKNLTSNSTLKFYGMRAEKKLNAFGADLTSDDGRLKEPPFVHDHSVAAGSEEFLSGAIRTEAEGAPSGTVRWIGLEDTVLVDDATGVEKELTKDDVLISSKVGGWLGNELTVRVIQDFSRPFAPPTLTRIEAVSVWSYGAMLSIGGWAYDGWMRWVAWAGCSGRPRRTRPCWPT